MNKCELLPGGQFIIRYRTSQFDEVKTYKGRFTMAALQRFATQVECDNVIDLADKILHKMSITDYAKIILCAIEDYYRHTSDGNGSGLTIDDVMDIMDETFGGVGNASFMLLMSHCVGRLTPVNEEYVQLLNEEEKKRMSSNGNGDSLSTEPLAADLP